MPMQNGFQNSNIFLWLFDSLLRTDHAKRESRFVFGKGNMNFDLLRFLTILLPFSTLASKYENTLIEVASDIALKTLLRQSKSSHFCLLVYKGLESHELKLVVGAMVIFNWPFWCKWVVISEKQADPIQCLFPWSKHSQGPGSVHQKISWKLCRHFGAGGRWNRLGRSVKVGAIGQLYPFTPGQFQWQWHWLVSSKICNPLDQSRAFSSWSSSLENGLQRL